MSIFQNACKPKGLGGILMVNSMNIGHAAMADWGMEHITVKETDHCLDVGCGGGANVKRLLKLCPKGTVKGLDYSSVSVDKTTAVNEKAIKEGRCTVLKGDVMNLMFAKNFFDVVTAFETVYFWPDIIKAFHEICKVLKLGGTFLICNESDGLNPADQKWVDKIEGMTIYTGEQLESALRTAGFTSVTIDRNEKHWLCAVASK